MNLTKKTVQSADRTDSTNHTLQRAPSLKDTTQNAPPINNALQPDIFSRLDAEVIERTRVVNTQLDMRLHVEEKIIRKYRHEAEKCLLSEQSRVAEDLNRITNKLPAVARIRDFDEKFFARRSTIDLSRMRHRKNYESERNEGPICERCYIHHMPLKKKFYRKVTPDLMIPAEDPSIPCDSLNKGSSPTNLPPTTEDRLLENHDVINSAVSGRRQYIPGANELYRFLERDTIGREKDLNKTQTPRLMPNEMWKRFVKNVCEQLVGSDLKTHGKRSRELSHCKTMLSGGKGRKEGSLSSLTLSRASSKLVKKSDTRSSTRGEKLKSGNRAVSRSDTSTS